MNKIKSLESHEFMISIAITENEGQIPMESSDLIKNLHLLSTIKPAIVKRSSPITKIYCIVKNISDYFSLIKREDLKIEKI